MPIKRVPKKPAPKTPPKPAPIPNGSGIDVMRMTEPWRDVYLDAGVFDYLWRIVEAHHERAVAKGDSTPGHAAHRDMLERAVTAFRAVVEVKEPEAAPSVPRRVLKRK